MNDTSCGKIYKLSSFFGVITDTDDLSFITHHLSLITIKTCLILAGPTAVGKTSLAIELAGHFNTGIISADSRQCYKELDIGVARPSASELKRIPHYFIASHSIHEEVNVKSFEKYALEAVEEIFLKNDFAIMVGGTGLYLRAFTQGIDEIPAIPPEIREEVRLSYERFGISWLQEQIADKDPVFYEIAEAKNPARLMRALEVIKSSGNSILDFHRGEPVMRNFRIIKIGLKLEKELLHRNINDRVDKMIGDGLVDEARRLYPFRYLKALQTVGYSEMFDFLDNKTSLEQAIEEIKKNTRRYAKRQMTWFNKEKDLRWFDAALGIGPLLDFIKAG